MMNYTPSIRQKITLGYYAIVLMIIGLSVFTFLELRYIEKKIMFGEAISEFFDTTLEIRRFEKELFPVRKNAGLRRERSVRVPGAGHHRKEHRGVHRGRVPVRADRDRPIQPENV